MHVVETQKTGVGTRKSNFIQFPYVGPEKQKHLTEVFVPPPKKHLSSVLDIFFVLLIMNANVPKNKNGRPFCGFLFLLGSFRLIQPTENFKQNVLNDLISSVFCFDVLRQ